MTLAILWFGCSALIFGMAGAALLYTYFQQRGEARASAGWPATEGKIIHTEVRASSSGDSLNTVYYPQIRYEYSVLGQTYTGSQITFGGTPAKNTLREAKKALAAYPYGASVTVYYNPENPQDAVLKRTLRGGALMLTLGSVFILSAGCLILAGLLTLTAK